MASWITKKTKKPTESIEEIDAIGKAYHDLWVAVILQAVKDYKRCNPRSYTEAQAYSYYSAKTFLSQNWVYDSIGINLTGEECLKILDKKSWEDLKTILGNHFNKEEE